MPPSKWVKRETVAGVRKLTCRSEGMRRCARACVLVHTEVRVLPRVGRGKELN